MINYLYTVRQFNDKMGDWNMSPNEIANRVYGKCNIFRDATDELTVVQSLTEMIYELFSFAVKKQLPIDELFMEIHRSRMTQEPNQKSTNRMGPNYSPPNISDILARQNT